MMHYGHSNALRQARSVGDELVVGLVGDIDIIKNKGSAPVMSFKERFEALRACKWVDKVIPDAPYDLTPEWVDYLVREHGIEYIVHGDDPCITADGKDAYAYAKSLGRFRMIKRTEGVSTTDIVGRMLLMTKEHHMRTPRDGLHPRLDSMAVGMDGAGSAPGSPVVPALGVEAGRSGSIVSLGEALHGEDMVVREEDEEDDDESDGGNSAEGETTPLYNLDEELDAGAGPAGDPLDCPSPIRTKSVSAQMRRIAEMQGPVRFLPTSRRFTQFSTGKAPAAGDTVVYVPGGWDLFNTGHIETLRKCKTMGSFVLVGVYDDMTINRLRGGGWPVLNQYERAMSVLACRYADEVVLDAPFHVTRDLMTNFDVALVVQPCKSDLLPPGDGSDDEDDEEEEEEGGLDSGASDPLLAPASNGGALPNGTAPQHEPDSSAAEARGAKTHRAGASSGMSVASATLSRRDQVRRALADAVSLPKKMRKLRRIALSPDLVFGDDIVRRVRERQAEMAARYRQKSKRETEYNQSKTHVRET